MKDGESRDEPVEHVGSKGVVTNPDSILCSLDLCETMRLTSERNLRRWLAGGKPLPSVTHEKVQPLSGWGRKRVWLNF